MPERSLPRRFEVSKSISNVRPLLGVQDPKILIGIVTVAPLLRVNVSLIQPFWLFHNTLLNCA